MVIALFIFFGMRIAIERDINYGLPNHIRAKSMGVINFLYILARLVAPYVIFIGIGNIRILFRGICLYIFAYSLKKIAWNFIYGI